MEHIFYYLDAYDATKENIFRCNLTGHVNFWEHLFHRERAHIFTVIPYSIWYMPLFQLENFAFSMSSSYVDILLISISIGISTRFWQLNERLKTDQNSVSFLSFYFYLTINHIFLDQNRERVALHSSTLRSPDRSSPQG